MQYILKQSEYDALTPVKRLQERNEALEVARKLIISDEDCKGMMYCCGCPIGKLLSEDHESMNLICVKQKRYGK